MIVNNESSIRRVAVLLTVFNRKNITVSGIKSLYASIDSLEDKYIFDIYMTDDGCTDGTAEEVSNLFPFVHVVQGEGNLYWNGGMLKAWKVAYEKKQYDAYLWFNDDSILYNDSIKELLRIAEKHMWNSVVVGSFCSEYDTKIVTYGGRNRKKELIFPDSKMELPCSTFNGNLVLIPKSVFRAVGFLDDKFTHSLGDFDYGFRCSELGFTNYISPYIVGVCDRHSKPPVWCDNSYGLTKRIRNFYSPLGCHPKEVFYFEKKHFGFCIAIFHVITNHLRLLFPFMWHGRSL